MSVRGIWVSVAMAAAVWCGSLSARAQQKAVPDESLRPVLVELFTSEGCSSCPPADELLRKLAGKGTDDGQLIVALSEHVTYWNQLGWKDPFSSDAFTRRQEIYGQRFHLDSVYTPQVVVNGEREMLGSDARAIVQAVQAQKATGGDGLRIVKAVETPGGVMLTFSVMGAVPKEAASLFAVVADDMDTSTVARGENGGRTLMHVAVARSLTRIGGYKAGEAMTVTLPLQKRSGEGAKGGQHVVLFAQADGQGSVLSVASAVLMEAFPQTASSADVH
jgi:hypothetical protein